MRGRFAYEKPKQVSFMHSRFTDDSLHPPQPDSPKRLTSKGSAEADLSPTTRRNAARLGTLTLEPQHDSKGGRDDRVDRRPSPISSGFGAPMSILKNAKNSTTSDREYARAKGGRFAAIYN